MQPASRPEYRLHYHQLGMRTWETIVVNPGAFSIGRLEDNDLYIQNAELSRHHARLQIDETNAWVMDLNASNGVIINGARIEPGKWVPLPPGTTFSLGPVTLRLDRAAAPQPRPQAAAAAGPIHPPVLNAPPPPPVRAPQVPPARPPVPPAKAPSRRALAFVGILFLCVCLTATVAGAGWLLYPRLSGFLETKPAENGEQALTLDPPSRVSSQPVNASAGSYTDEHGASLAIPAALVPAEEVLTVETASLSKGMQTELERAFTVEGLAYSVTSGSQDGAGRPSFSLPAPSPDSRLAVLVDDQFLALLPTLPENGALTFQPFLGAPAAEGYPSMTAASLPNRYFVVTPKAGASQPPGGSRRLASLAEDPDVVSCIPLIWRGNRCWTNKAGTVTVLFWNTEMPAALAGSDPLRPPEVIDNIIRNVASIMTTFRQAGFTNAATSSSNSVYIVISAKETEPNYSPKTGNVYLGWDVVSEILAGSGNCTLAHELFHWVEDESYAMNGAALINARAWWLEMGAENGSFLVDTACIGRTVSTYGLAESGGQLAWQAAPFQWDWGEGSRYIQSLQMYISICDGGRCFVSPDEFARLINSGSYPSDAARDAYYRNADDMGRYLLGFAPLQARGDAIIPPALKNGSGYGDFILLKAVPKPALEFSLNASRIRKTGDLEATAETTIAHGGAYPLWVSNGKGTPTGGREGYTSLPGVLTIAPGAPFWYTLDNGLPIFNDGTTELNVGPISDKLGIGLVRLVATAPDVDQTFKAVIKPLDLSGDWANKLSGASITSIDCPEREQDENSPEAADILTFFSAYGTFVPDPAVTDGSHYLWEGELPDQIAAQSDITVMPDKIIAKFSVEIPKPQASSLFPWLPAAVAGFRPLPPAAPPAAAAWLLLGGLALVAALRYWPPKFALPASFARAGLLLVMAVSAGVWLTGCFGLQFWGTFSGTYTYTRLEAADAANLPAGAAELPGITWVLTEGTGEILYDLHFQVTTEDTEGNEITEEQTCKITFETNLTGFVGASDMVPLPEE